MTRETRFGVAMTRFGEALLIQELDGEDSLVLELREDDGEVWVVTYPTSQLDRHTTDHPAPPFVFTTLPEPLRALALGLRRCATELDGMADRLVAGPDDLFAAEEDLAEAELDEVGQ